MTTKQVHYAQCVITIQTINETPDPCSVDIEFEKVDSNHILCKLFYMCQGKN